MESYSRAILDRKDRKKAGEPIETDVSCPPLMHEKFDAHSPTPVIGCSILVCFYSRFLYPQKHPMYL